MPEPASLANNRPPRLTNLDDVVEAFEVAWNRDGNAEVADYFPEATHPHFQTIALELLCVDLERRWNAGLQPCVDDYVRRFPQLLSPGSLLERFAFEEYRQRHERGQTASPTVYASRFHIDTDHWPRPSADDVPAETDAGPATCDPSSPAARPASRPRRPLGPAFRDFEIVRRLGAGTFAQVYLARQASLAGRLVVLKVTKTRWSETDRLARLQHTHVVPVYSVHQDRDQQVVCMPYFGQHTLADLLWSQGSATRVSVAAFVARFDGQASSSADADRPVTHPVPPWQPSQRWSDQQLAVSLVSRITSGLAHAHARGILHRDLKPANILLTDDGQPMLLDFNLSADVAGDATSELIGGTLPYMSPEHLRAVAGRGDVDARSDLYAMGVILFQMLTGELPFATRADASSPALERLARSRWGPIPSARQRNPQISPAVDAMIRRCLAADPGQRYQSADELLEDLDRQLRDLPLKHAPDRSLRERTGKWLRRHPRITSAGSLGVVAAVALIVVSSLLAWRHHQVVRLQAVQTFGRFAAITRQARVPLSLPTADVAVRRVALERAERALALYEVEADQWQSRPAYSGLPDETRRQLDHQLQELLYLVSADALRPAPKDAPTGDVSRRQARALGLNETAQRLSAEARPPDALLRQQRALRLSLGREQPAAQPPTAVPNDPDRSPLDQHYDAIQRVLQKDYAGALPELTRLRDERPDDFLLSFLTGTCLFGLDRFSEAEACFIDCTTLWPQAPWPHFQRGMCALMQDDYAQAEHAFSEALRREPPRQIAARYNRGHARFAQGHAQGAIDDYTAVIKLGREDALVYLLRAKAYHALGDTERAERDRREGLRRRPIDVDGWIQRGLARLAEDPDGALADLDEALVRDPTSRRALHNRALILAAGLQRNEDALRTLDRLLLAHPQAPDALAMRGRLHAELGHRDAALTDAQACLRSAPSGLTFYQAACIMAQTSRVVDADGDEAVRLLREAIRREVGRAQQARDEPDLEPLRRRGDFQQLLAAAAVLQGNEIDTADPAATR